LPYCVGNVVTRYENAPATGLVWSGSAWASASCTLSCGNLPYCTTQCQVADNSIFNELLKIALGYNANAADICGGLPTVPVTARAVFGCNTSGSCNSDVVQASCFDTECTDACYNGQCVLCYPGTTTSSGCNTTGSCSGAIKTCNASGTAWSACSILPDNSASYHSTARNGSFDWNCDGAISLDKTNAYVCSMRTVGVADAGISFFDGSDCDGSNRHYGYNGVWIYSSPLSAGYTGCATGSLYPSYAGSSYCGQTVGLNAGSGGTNNPYNATLITPSYGGPLDVSYCSSNGYGVYLYFSPETLNCR
jgi:hypothetical protein